MENLDVSPKDEKKLNTALRPLGFEKKVGINLKSYSFNYGSNRHEFVDINGINPHARSIIQDAKETFIRRLIRDYDVEVSVNNKLVCLNVSEKNTFIKKLEEIKEKGIGVLSSYKHILCESFDAFRVAFEERKYNEVKNNINNKKKRNSASLNKQMKKENVKNFSSADKKIILSTLCDVFGMYDGKKPNFQDVIQANYIEKDSVSLNYIFYFNDNTEYGDNVCLFTFALLDNRKIEISCREVNELPYVKYIQIDYKDSYTFKKEVIETCASLLDEKLKRKMR